MDKSKEVYRIVSGIAKGKVMTYGQIGKILGMNPRNVGKILHENTRPQDVPCHRVVNSHGEVAKSYTFGGGAVQKQKLLREGVIFVGGRVDMGKCFYKRNT